MTAATAGSPDAPVKTPRKAALASFVGSMVEYYDFFLYGTAAALVFPKIFFPTGNPSVATLASLATFGVGYVARPIGAVVLGHFGDRIGRRRVLVATLLLMGTSTFLIGALPTYATIGVAAPILLVLLRLLQGFSAGGEQSGANSLTLEHAPEGRRAFFTSFTLGGTQAGNILATLVFIPVSLLPDDQLLSWGWRIPFFLSAIVVFVGWWVRRSMPETPEFKRVAEHHEVAKLPVAVLFRDHTPAVLRVIFCALISVVSTIFGIYSLSYATTTIGLSKTPMLLLVVLGNVIALGAIPLWGRISDGVGRKPIFVLGTFGSAALIFPFLWAIQRGSYPLIFLFGLLLSGIVYSAANAIWPSLYGEMFSTPVRYSGLAIGTQIGFALGGFSPAIAAAIGHDGPTGWVPVAVFTAGAAVISGLCALTARETYRVPLELLGTREAAQYAGRRELAGV